MPSGASSAITPGRCAALGVASLSRLAIALDVTMANVALPTVAVELASSESQLQGIVGGCTLACAALLLTGLCLRMRGRF